MFRLVLIGCLLLAGFTAIAQEPSLDDFYTAVEHKRLELRADSEAKKIQLRTQYATALKAADDAARQQGELESLLALRKEYDAINANTAWPPERELPESVLRMRSYYSLRLAEYQHAGDESESQFLRMVLSRLEAWKVSYTQQNRIEDALLVSDGIRKYERVIAKMEKAFAATVENETRQPAIATPSAPVRLTLAQSAKLRALRQKAALHLAFDQKAAPAPDLTGNGNNASFKGEATIVRGGKGVGTLYLKGNDSYATLNPKPFDSVRPLTIALWVKGEDPGMLGRYDRLIHKGDDTGASRCFGIACERGNGMLVGFHQESNRGNKPRNQISVQTNTIFENETWYHVVMTYDGNQALRMYVNGKDDSSSQKNKTPWYTKGNGNHFELGRMPGESDDIGFQGMLDEVMIWNQALDAEEIELLFAGYASNS